MAKTNSPACEADLIKKTKEPHDLGCKLTTKQRAVAAEQLAETIQNLDAVEDERKTAAKEFAEKKQRLTADLRVLSRHVKDGTAIKSVGCELALNYKTRTATLTRLDTNEEVLQRPMTEEEKQMKMSFDSEKEE